MILIQSTRGVALCGPGYFAPVAPIDTVWAYQNAGVPLKTITVDAWDRIKAHAAANPPFAADINALANAMAGPIGDRLAVRLQVLPDLDIERIRDAAVEALELSKGTLNTTTNIMRFNRVAQQ